jgi:hypothetical protein
VAQGLVRDRVAADSEQKLEAMPTVLAQGKLVEVVPPRQTPRDEERFGVRRVEPEDSFLETGLKSVCRQNQRKQRRYPQAHP